MKTKEGWKGKGMTMELSKLYEDLKKNGIIFCFSGAISQGIVEGIGET